MNKAYGQTKHAEKEVAMANRVVPVTGRVMPQNIVEDGPEQAVATVDIVVPAFNEGGCIEDLLNDMVMAKQDD